ncbi:MAG: V-type ATP synthase subunit A, partial [Gammaproteobacteria bacterium]|nr:V-type ATP synthase subunit A [Gammaproteobacteria bacterium]
PGGDFSEPVTSHTKEIIQTFWALSKELADARHYPAIDWLESFSGYVDAAAKWWATTIDPRWEAYRNEALKLLADSEELQRIVNLVGVEALSSEQRWTLETAGLIKEGLLQQSAIDEIDSYASPEKQFLLLQSMLDIHHHGLRLVKLGMPVRKLLALPVLSAARRWKNRYDADQLDELRTQLNELPAIFEHLGADYSPAGESGS